MEKFCEQRYILFELNRVRNFKDYSLCFNKTTSKKLFFNSSRASDGFNSRSRVNGGKSDY